MTITDVLLLVSLSDWVGAGIGFAQPTSIIADDERARDFAPQPRPEGCTR